MPEYNVFVYGSLKNGFGNNRLLHKSELVCSTKTKDKWRMNSLGGFPGVLRDKVGYVSGEMYKVDEDTLKSLDRLESNGHFYLREEVELEGDKTAWMYVLMNEQGTPIPVDVETQTYNW